MSVLRWINDFKNDEAIDPKTRFILVNLASLVAGKIKEDPAAALDYAGTSRGVAESLHEPAWVLMFDHLRLQVLIHYLRDFRSALDLAVAATLEARKPAYAGLPHRVCLHDDLINAYVGTDPAGYADGIRPALDFMAREVAPDSECRYCIQGCTTDFALQCGRLDEAEQSARRELDMAAADPADGDRHAAYNYLKLCQIAFRRGDWNALREAALVAEESARRYDDVRELAECLVWQGLIARRDGDEQAARRLVRQAAARIAHTAALPGPSYHDALCAFYEMAGDLDRALKTRSHELELVAGKGRLLTECLTRTKRCRLLRQMGLPLADDLAAAREAARKLRDPAPHLEELDRIEAGAGP
jgi:hypothetical protein